MRLHLYWVGLRLKFIMLISMALCCFVGIQLREYVDDTEDYINIMLDDKQNHLLQMGVMLTTATLVISAFIVVVGVFGMNINIPLFNNGGPPQFFGVVFGSAAGCVLFYILVIGWCKYKNLIE